MQKISYKNILKILFIYLIIYIPIVLKRFPDIRNEIKYYAITDNLIKSREFFILKYFSELYPDKPPLYFWLIGFFKENFENFNFLSIFFGSIIPSFIIVILMYHLFTKLKSEKFGFLVAISLATTPFFIGISVFLRMDMLMNLFITISLYYFFSTYFNLIKNNWFNKVILYLSIFLGIFTKGIAGGMVPLSIILGFLILEKNLTFLKKINFLGGVGVILFCALAWFSLIYLQPEGKEYLALMFKQETVGRIVKAKTHIKPFYYYFVRLSFLIFPYSLFWYSGIFHYLKDIKNYSKWNYLEKIGVIWSIVPLILFSLASGKLDIYMLPLFTGMILLSLNFFIKIKNKKIGKVLLKILSTILIISLFLNKILKNRGNQYRRFLTIPLSIVIIFGILAQGMGTFNRYFTLKPVVAQIQDNRKIYTYRFEDFKNIEGIEPKIKDSNITNIQELEKIKDILNKDNSKNYFVIKSKYNDKFNDVKNLKLKFTNNSYSIFERE
ncbi:glycosyltransferase family 39 protein [uncultured Fusobacterium sp.]|uniref:ArnT family glycosyltransferase n=1 Tax=uncultured Fusobacterium sp. TaxID=159267 RepID=UPI0025F55230|nr:glycosyltransferase family 39 protein [uncultured Fusobacterium sp.]